MDMSGDGVNNFDMGSGQSLDDMVSQNDKAYRRRSMPVYGQSTVQMGSPDSRRMSMMSFGDPTSGDLDNFQFSLPTDPGIEGMLHGGADFPSTSREMQNLQSMQSSRQMAVDLSINTDLSNHNAHFSTIPAPGSAYASPMHPNVSMDMDMASPYPAVMPMSMDMGDALAMIPGDMSLFPNNQFTNSIIDSPASPAFIGPQPAPPQDPIAVNLQSQDQFRHNSLSATPDPRSSLPSRTSSRDQSSAPSISQPHSEQPSSSQSITTQISLARQAQEPAALTSQQDIPADSFSQIQFPWRTPPGGFPSTMHANPHMSTQFKNAYSSTGFDMLGVLMRVATRTNPAIDIGSVDLSCAFVVCDAEQSDNPIAYCSENFERLTGYSKHMILGRNCRFLQSPDGKVESGIKRKYVDDDSVYYLKNMINARSEAQISLINYRRGGQPFMNLLTMIPISWEVGGPIRYIVGFQVDLVEQPGSMTNKNAGKYSRIRQNVGYS